MKNFCRYMHIRTIFTYTRRIVDYNKCPPYFSGKYLLPGFKYDNIKNFPDKMDWFELGAVIPPRDQGPFDTCYAFTVAGAMESADFLFGSRKLQVLSPQELVDFKYYSAGINGGCTLSCLDHATARGGLCKESDYPYMGTHTPSPTFMLPRFGERLIGYQRVPVRNVVAFKKAVANQPIVCSMLATQEFMDHRGDEIFTSIYDRLKETEERHSILAIGHGPNYILLKNSWGCRWGGRGFVKISINSALSHGLFDRCLFPLFDNGSNDESENFKILIAKENILNATPKENLMDFKPYLLNHGKTLEEGSLEVELVEKNTCRTMFSPAELENSSEDFHILSSDAKEQGSHCEASEDLVNERLGDDNLCVPLTFTAGKTILLTDNLQSVARHDAQFAMWP